MTSYADSLLPLRHLQVPNEQELLTTVVAKVGPFADKEKLLYHIRVSAGKVHWAVNSYLRSILAAPAPDREDFDSKPCQGWRQSTADHLSVAATVNKDNQLQLPPGMMALPVPGASSQHRSDAAQQQRQGDLATTPQGSSRSGSEAASPSVSTATPSAVTLQSLPGNVVDSVLALLDLQSLVCAASSCKALYKAAQSERIWRQLFIKRWGAVIFPTSKYSSERRCRSTAPQPAATQDTAARRCTAAAAGQAVALGSAADSATIPSGGSVELKQAAPAVTNAASTAAGCGSAGGSSSSTAFVSRWTGSSVCHGSCSSSPATSTAAAGGSPAGAANTGAGTGRNNPISSNWAEGNSQFSSSDCCCNSSAGLPAAAPAGNWRLQYRQQHSYQAARKCPKCGAAAVVPVVYGFPSGPLLAGMSQKRLLLGGDHLIDSCHVWACSSCRSCYRFYPYSDVQRWLQDDEAQQRMDQARSAAGRGTRVEAAGGAAGRGVGPQHGGLDTDGIIEDNAGEAVVGMPRYTYEL
eukprot:GHUV01010587.1.p1 GENE.GHUV01010587.1~~GHUV01010587.1.p1  ORF type:complete len:522 (+),score=175.53 GHUV01010587.1:134-1699(+)